MKVPGVYFFPGGQSSSGGDSTAMDDYHEWERSNRIDPTHEYRFGG